MIYSILCFCSSMWTTQVSWPFFHWLSLVQIDAALSTCTCLEVSGFHRFVLIRDTESPLPSICAFEITCISIPSHRSSSRTV
ncbi:uncharacterized protein B0H18DRAFT_1071049 [Fomitopsis serialis]|uniref:uncharacterized protein n=1 Tax=Fomitopsis serialis TaxID=139415 RepID=UPI0020072E7C|nr:uncharacterized protein B0H18DRAFT_1071049 [Neoantrodia serialis]KAH9910316.1 hypothetical protein B0H18DRAFT_1071049 [Neoantrodia serialis]